MSHSVPLPPSLPPLWAPREPPVPQPTTGPIPVAGKKADRQRWTDRVTDSSRPDISCMEVRSLAAADGCTVSVSGEIDSMTAPGLQEILLDVLDRPQFSGGVTVDLGRVTFLGAVGLTVLAVGHHLAENTGRVLRIRCGSSRAVIRPLQVTGLWDLLHIVERERAEEDC